MSLMGENGGGGVGWGVVGVGLCLDSEHLVLVTVDPVDSLSLLAGVGGRGCLLYTSPSPRDRLVSRMPSSA